MDWFPGCKPWSNTMEILHEKDGVDTELLVYAMTLINKVSKSVVSMHWMFIYSLSLSFSIKYWIQEYVTLIGPQVLFIPYSFQFWLIQPKWNYWIYNVTFLFADACSTAWSGFILRYGGRSGGTGHRNSVPKTPGAERHWSGLGWTAQHLWGWKVKRPQGKYCSLLLKSY